MAKKNGVEHSWPAQLVSPIEKMGVRVAPNQALSALRKINQKFYAVTCVEAQ